MADAKTINTRIVLRNDELARWERSEKQLLKGEVAFARLSGTNDFEMRIGTGDKTWNQLSGSNVVVPDSTKFYEVTLTSQIALADKVNALSNYNAKAKNGDIGVVKEFIADGKYSHTAYRWDKVVNGWVALDGNYNAENVYFDSNITITQAFGNNAIDTSTGRGNIPCTGWNIRDLISKSFSKPESSGQNAPTCSITTPSNYNDGSEVGTWESGANGNNAIIFKYTADGSWKNYNSGKTGGVTVPLSGITITRTASMTKQQISADAILSTWNYNIDTITRTISSDSSENLTLNTPVTMPAIAANDLCVQYRDSDVTLYTYTVSNVKYNAGTTTPVNNLGEDDPDNKIKAGTWTGKSSTSVVLKAGKRKRFWYVGTDSTTVLNSAFFRSNKCSNDLNSNTKTISLAIPAGTTRVVFALKDTGKTLKSVIDVDGMGLDVKGTFTPKTISIEGANGYTTADYTVFECINPAGLKKTTYNITVN